MRHASLLGRALPISVAALAVGCGVKEIPPPKAPDQTLPQIADVPTDAPRAGAGRVVLDTPGEKARVVEVMGVTQGFIQGSNGASAGYAAMTTRPVCTTPCVADLDRGTHTLVFASQADEERVSAAEVEVGSNPKAVRHAIGSQKTHPGLGILAGTSLVLGVTGLITGGSFFAVGAIEESAATPRTSSASDMKQIGTNVLLIGGALTIVGGVLAYLARPEVQPGASTEWPLAPTTQGSPGIQRTAVGPRVDATSWQ